MQHWVSGLCKPEVQIIQFEKISESKLIENFTDTKYGTYHRNICGIIKLMHYPRNRSHLLKRCQYGRQLLNNIRFCGKVKKG
jgi:hypothetical protein